MLIERIFKLLVLKRSLKFILKRQLCLFRDLVSPMLKCELLDVIQLHYKVCILKTFRHIRSPAFIFALNAFEVEERIAQSMTFGVALFPQFV